jgi:alkylation response protein AidB-like acyl-CoA dehydrogenase
MARRVHFRPTMAKIFATLEHVYAAFAQMYANSKPIRWHRDLDAAIHSAGGLSDDFPLSAAWTSARALRLADGPDEVHRGVVARIELDKHA